MSNCRTRRRLIEMSIGLFAAIGSFSMPVVAEPASADGMQLQTDVAESRTEVSADGHTVAGIPGTEGDHWPTLHAQVQGGSIFPATPNWSNTLRRQVGGLQVVDMDGDGWNDVVVGCYNSNSFPPYED